MKKPVQLALSFLCIFLLLVSFPVRDVWNQPNLSDLCRIVGFGLLFFLNFWKIAKKESK